MSTSLEDRRTFLTKYRWILLKIRKFSNRFVNKMPTHVLRLKSVHEIVLFMR